MANNLKAPSLAKLLQGQQTSYRPAKTTEADTELVTAPEGSPAMTAREVQDVVRANGNQAAQASQAAATALPTTGMGVQGVGKAGSGQWYNLVGPGGKISTDNQAAFLAAAPGAYNSPYADAMQRTLNGLLNPEQFQYDVNADGLYQQIKDNYLKAGRQAMMDTQGQSAALTGGYGNSYGTMAGQQAYQESLGNLAGMIPELQQLAYQQWLQGQNDQRNNLEALNKLDAQDYARWQDEQKAYQELLKTLPAAQQTLSGGGGGLDISLPALTGGAKGSGTQLDPSTWAATVEGIQNGTLSAMGILSGIENGTTWKGMDTNTMREAALYTMSPETYGNNYPQTARNFSSAHQANHSTKGQDSGNASKNPVVNKNRNNKSLND